MVRVLCFCLTVLLTVLVFLAAKLGLLYLFGFQDWVTPPISDLDVPTPSSEEPVTQSAAHLEALQELRRGNAKAALAKARGCAAEHGGCRGLLGELYLTGTEVAQDLAQAMHWFQAGADLGDPDSQYALGVLYANLLEESSPELQKNEGLSILYLYAASLVGHLGAMMAMGYRHSEGLGAPRACGTAALNYIEVARRVAQVYSSGMPKAVELVRLGVDSRDRQMSLSEMAVFVEIAASGDANVAAAVGKRYLLGLEGFHQNYARAAGHLTTAAQKHHPNAMALLGYMYSLGLGVTKDLDRAYRYFHDAASRDDALGHNGLGFIHFHGTKIRAQSFDLAFRHFNISAHAGSGDGMFNLASLYLTGTGTDQSFQRAAHWYTQALDRGHTPAAYTLAVMHLNGIGAVRNCKMAVELLKRVCERGAWVSGKLREAYELQEKQSSEGAAWRFLQLAEAGHEVAQMNAAHLFDSGAASFLLNTSEGVEEPAEDRRWGRFFAQRHYELSAEQGNAFSELRLGDFAYYGWGFRLHSSAAVADEDFQKDEAEGAQPADLAERRVDSVDTWQLVAQESDIDLSLAHYRRTATMRIAGEWMQPYVARAHFNLGYMHQFGVGVMQDLPLARRHYMQSAAADPGGTHTPITIMACLLSLQHFLVDMPKPEVLAASVLGDVRFHILVVHMVAIIVLCGLRSMLTRTPRPPAVPRTERDHQTDRHGPFDEGDDSDVLEFQPPTMRRGHAPSRSPRSGSPVDGLRRRRARSRSR